VETDNTHNSAATLAIYSSPPSVHQAHTGSYTGISNEFSMIRKLRNGRNVIELFSYLEQNTHPQQLTATPGLYDAMLNNGNAYTSFTQSVKLPGIFTSNYATYRQALGRATWISQAGFSYQLQKVESTLELLQASGPGKLLSDSFQNNTRWERVRIFLQQGLEWKEERWHLQLSLPLNFQQTALSNPYHPGGDTVARMAPFSPSVTLSIMSGKQNSLQLQAYMDKKLGNIEDSYRGFIFNNYRRMTRHNTALPLQSSRGIAVNYYFKRALEGFFVNTGFSFIRNESNTMENAYISNSIQVSDIMYADNPATFIGFSGSASKYFYKRNTTVKIGFSKSWQTFRQFQNSLSMTSRNINTSGRLRVDSRFSERVLYDYTANFAEIQVYQDLLVAGSKTQVARVYLMNHELNLNILFGKIMYLTCSLEDFWNRMPGAGASNYLFWDLKATIKLPAMRSDIQLAALNLLNNDSFRTQYITTNVLSDSRYSIRPRSLMVKFAYRF
jgi:hypothetical protein